MIAPRLCRAVVSVSRTFDDIEVIAIGWYRGLHGANGRRAIVDVTIHTARDLDRVPEHTLAGSELDAIDRALQDDLERQLAEIGRADIGIANFCIATGLSVAAAQAEIDRVCGLPFMLSRTERPTLPALAFGEAS